jgi:hypothetical protein
MEDVSWTSLDDDHLLEDESMALFGDEGVGLDESDLEISSADEEEIEEISVNIGLQIFANLASNTSSSIGPGKDFLDTGTTTLLSDQRADFDEDSTMLKRKCRIVGIGNPKIGVKMATRPNNLGFEYGVYLDDLPTGVRRLVPVPAEHKLQNFETGVSGYIERKSDGVRLELTHSVPPQVLYKTTDLEEHKIYYTQHQQGKVQPMRVHQRLCHLVKTTKSKKCRCVACMMGKSVRKSFKKQRETKYKRTKPLHQLDADFVGQLSPESVRGRRYGLLVICPKTKMFWCIPIKHKSENVDRVRELLVEIKSKYGSTIADRVVFYFRTDNEYVWDGNFKKFLQSNRVLPLRPPPYCPQLNSIVERQVRNLVEGLRAMLIGVDRSLWCYAMEMYCIVWNLVRIDVKTGRTPVEDVELELLHEDDPRRGEHAVGEDKRKLNLEKLPFRRFGSLSICYIEDPVKKRNQIGNDAAIGKFAPNWYPGVYLGHDPQSSNAMIGVWVNERFTRRRERHV